MSPGSRRQSRARGAPTSPQGLGLWGLIPAGAHTGDLSGVCPAAPFGIKTTSCLWTPGTELSPVLPFRATGWGLDIHPGTATRCNHSRVNPAQRCKSGRLKKHQPGATRAVLKAISCVHFITINLKALSPSKTDPTENPSPPLPS